MRVYLSIFIGALIFCTSCSEQSVESVPEAGHTALGTSAPPTINPVRTDSLQYLAQYIGQTPKAANLWETEPLRSKLEDLLGNDFETFLQLMQQAAPLQQERVLYTISSTTNGDMVAFLLVDTDNNKLHVSIMEGGIRKQYQTPGEELYLPSAVEQLL